MLAIEFFGIGLICHMMIVRSPWPVGGVLPSLLTFVVCGCALFTTPEAAVIVASPIYDLSTNTIFYTCGRSTYVVAGLLFFLSICSYQVKGLAYKRDGEEETKDFIKGTHPKAS